MQLRQDVLLLTETHWERTCGFCTSKIALHDPAYRSVQTNSAGLTKILPWCIPPSRSHVSRRHTTLQHTDLCVTHMLKNYITTLQTSKLDAAVYLRG